MEKQLRLYNFDDTLVVAFNGNHASALLCEHGVDVDRFVETPLHVLHDDDEVDLVELNDDPSDEANDRTVNVKASEVVRRMARPGVIPDVG